MLNGFSGTRVGEYQTARGVRSVPEVVGRGGLAYIT